VCHAPVVANCVFLAGKLPIGGSFAVLVGALNREEDFAAFISVQVVPRHISLIQLNDAAFLEDSKLSA
jgi:hypothetical protein